MGLLSAVKKELWFWLLFMSDHAIAHYMCKQAKWNHLAQVTTQVSIILVIFQMVTYSIFLALEFLVLLGGVVASVRLIFDIRTGLFDSDVVPGMNQAVRSKATTYKGSFINDVTQMMFWPPLSRSYELCLMHFCRTITNPPPPTYVTSFMNAPQAVLQNLCKNKKLFKVRIWTYPV